jgi:hypothetical protein
VTTAHQTPSPKLLKSLLSMIVTRNPAASASVAVAPARKPKMCRRSIARRARRRTCA